VKEKERKRQSRKEHTETWTHKKHTHRDTHTAASTRAKVQRSFNTADAVRRYIDSGVSRGGPAKTGLKMAAARVGVSKGQWRDVKEKEKRKDEKDEKQNKKEKERKEKKRNE